MVNKIYVDTSKLSDVFCGDKSKYNKLIKEVLQVIEDLELFDSSETELLFKSISKHSKKLSSVIKCIEKTKSNVEKVVNNFEQYDSSVKELIESFDSDLSLNVGTAPVKYTKKN